MSVRSYRLSRKKVTVLLQSLDCTLNTDLTNQVPSNVFIDKVYTCSDGSVLEVLNDGFANLYNTRQDWLISLAELKSLIDQLDQSEPTHILDGRLPHGQQFSKVCAEVATQLHGYFNIDARLLNKSLESLAELDRAVQEKDKLECLSPAIFESLLAYIGEVIKNTKESVYWEMKKVHHSNSNDIWEPFLVISNQRYPIFINLYDELYEAKKVSLRSLVESFL